MKKNEWFESFESALDGLYDDEKNRAKEYYEELYADKLEQGVDEEDILKEFGEPETAARKIKDAAGTAVETAKECVEDTSVTVVDDTSGGEKSADNAKRTGKPLSAFGRAFSALAPLAALVLFFIDGAILHRWATAWLFFIATPVAITLEIAIEKKNAARFAYPVFVLLLYMMFGFYFTLWHPMWILFMTIPLYYVVVKIIRDARGETDECESCGAEQTKTDGYGADGSAPTSVVGPNSGGEKPKRKSKWWIGLIIAVAVTTAVALSGFAIVSAIRGLAGSFKPSQYNLAAIDTSEGYEIDGAEVTKINVEADVCAVFIEPTDDAELSINYVKKGFDKATLTAKVDDGVISVKVESEWICKVLFPLSGVNAADRFLLIKVPVSMTGTPDYVVKVATGDVRITAEDGANALAFKDVQVECVTGDVKIKDMTANDLSVKSTTSSVCIENTHAKDITVKNVTGNVRLNDVNADKLAVKVTTGDVKTDNVTITEELTVDLVTGETDVNATSKKVALNKTSGKIKFTLTADDITIKSTTGAVEGVINGVREEYTIKSNVTTGKNRLGEQSGTTDKKLTVTMTTGDLDIRFE